MAKAIVPRVDQAYIQSGNLFMDITVVFAGADVPGNRQVRSIAIDLSGVVNLADLATTTAAAVRANATANGYTVGANLVFLPSYVAA